MKKLLLICILIAASVVSCKTMRPDDVAGGSNLLSSATYILRLQEEGKLPGIQRTEQITLRSVPIERSGIKDTNEPLRVTIMVSVTTRRDLLYWYVVKRLGTESSWKITEAYRTNSDGKNQINLLSSQL